MGYRAPKEPNYDKQRTFVFPFSACLGAGIGCLGRAGLCAVPLSIATSRSLVVPPMGRSRVRIFARYQCCSHILAFFDGEFVFPDDVDSPPASDGASPHAD